MRYIFLTFILLITNNCTSPQINQHKDNTLSISAAERVLVEGKGSELYKNPLHLSHINIYQYIYNINKHYITYEYIKATDGYRFTKGVKRSIGIIFDTNAYDLDYTKGNLYFFTLKPNNKESIFLIVENINSSALKLVYGLDKATYEKIKEAVKENKVLKNTQIQNSNIEQKELSHYIQTKWSPKVIIMDQLVSKPIGRAPMGRR